MVLTSIIKSLRNYLLNWEYKLTQGTHVRGQNPLAKTYMAELWNTTVEEGQIEALWRGTNCAKANVERLWMKLTEKCAACDIRRFRLPSILREHRRGRKQYGDLKKMEKNITSQSLNTENNKSRCGKEKCKWQNKKVWGRCQSWKPKMNGWTIKWI